MLKALKTCVLAIAVAGPLLAGPAAAATPQNPAPPAQGQTEPTPAEGDAPIAVSPRQLQQFHRSLNQTSSLRLDERQLRFYLEIIARRPTFAEYTRGYDFVNGPTKRGNPMSHQEFVDMVTPKEMYSSAGITATEQLQMALTNWFGQSLIRKALDELKGAKTEREVMEIRERIDRELEALTGSVRRKTQ